MTRPLPLRPALFAAAAVALLGTAPAVPQQTVPRAPARSRPRLEAVAETKLLMEGLLQANFRGLERNLRILIDWLLDIPFRHDIAVLAPDQTERLQRGHYEVGDEVITEAMSATRPISSMPAGWPCSRVAFT